MVGEYVLCNFSVQRKVDALLPMLFDEICWDNCFIKEFLSCFRAVTLFPRWLFNFSFNIWFCFWSLSFLLYISKLLFCKKSIGCWSFWSDFVCFPKYVLWGLYQWIKSWNLFVQKGHFDKILNSNFCSQFNGFSIMKFSYICK